jgi:hypothetical protein
MQEPFTIDMFDVGIYLIFTRATSVAKVTLVEKSRSVTTFSGGSLDRIGKKKGLQNNKLLDASLEFFDGLVFRRHQTVIGYVSRVPKIRYTSGRAQK